MASNDTENEEENMFLDEFDESTKCAICLHWYRDPRNLPCLHTYCAQCLETVADVGTPGYIHCPACNAEHETPGEGVSGFPKAFLQTSLASTMQRFEVLNLRGDTMCSVCLREEKKSPGKLFCTECIETLCDDCGKVHRQLMSSHEIISCENLKEGNLNMIMKHLQGRCAEHNEVIKFFCETDQELLCMTCALMDHATHRKKEVGKAAKVYEEAMENKLLHIEEHLARYQTFIDDTDERKEMFEEHASDVSREVSKWAERAIKNIRSYESQMGKDIQKKLDSVLQDVNTRHKEFEMEVSRLSRCQKLINTALRQSNSCSIIETSVHDMEKLEMYLNGLDLSPEVPSFKLQFTVTGKRERPSIKSETLPDYLGEKRGPQETPNTAQPSYQGVGVEAKASEAREGMGLYGLDDERPVSSRVYPSLPEFGAGHLHQQHVRGLLPTPGIRQRFPGVGRMPNRFAQGNRFPLPARPFPPNFQGYPNFQGFPMQGTNPTPNPASTNQEFRMPTFQPRAGTSFLRMPASGTLFEAREVKKFLLPQWIKGPGGVCCTNDDDIIVCELDGAGLCVYTSGGDNKHTLPISANANAQLFDVTSDAEHVYASNRKSNKVFVFENKGWKQCKSVDGYSDGVCKVENNLFVTKAKCGQVNYVTVQRKGKTVSFDSAVDLYCQSGHDFGCIAVMNYLIVVTCSEGQHVHAFDRTGNPLWVFGGKETGQVIASPWGVAIDARGRVLVSDTASKSIYILNHAGELIGHINLKGTAIPRGIAINMKGQLVVAMAEHAKKKKHHIRVFEY